MVEAMHLMALVIAASIVRQGHWPTSEADLNTVGPLEVGGTSWPADRKKIFDRVEIDYEATIAEVSRDAQESFRALRPVDPNHETASTRNAFERLRVALEKAQAVTP